MKQTHLCFIFINLMLKEFIMLSKQLSLNFMNFIVKVLPEVIKEAVEEGFLAGGIAPEKMERAVKEAVEFHGKMQLFKVDNNVEDEELVKTVEHILSNQEEFKRYLKNKIVFA